MNTQHPTTAEPQAESNTISIHSLTWKPIEAPEHAPEIVCDQCNIKHPANGQLATEIAVTKHHTMTLVVCSDKCLYMLKRRKNIDNILRKTVNNARKKLRMAAIKMMGR